MEALGSTSRVATFHDIVKGIWVLVQNRVEEANWRFLGLNSLLVDESNYACENRCRCRSSAIKRVFSIVDKQNVDTVCGDIGVASCALRIIVLLGGIGGLEVVIVVSQCVSLVIRLLKDIGESAATRPFEVV